MKKRSTIRLENFLLISGKTLGATIWAFLASWVVVPVRSVRDARIVSRKLARPFAECFADIYDENVCRHAQVPMNAYIAAKLRAEQRLKEFDSKSK